jgi:hypothetical protein
VRLFENIDIGGSSRIRVDATLTEFFDESLVRRRSEVQLELYERGGAGTSSLVVWPSCGWTAI